MSAEFYRNPIWVTAPKGRGLICMFARALLTVFLAAAFLIQVRAQGYIQFQAIDLADTTVGQDLWRFQYSLGGFDFQAGQGFSIFFDPQLYTDLQNPQPDPSPIWSAIVVQPDVILQQPGYFDSQALVNSPSLAGIFQVDCVWLGQGIPGPQLFSIYDVNFSTISGGSTVTAVPEPRALMFLSLGILFLWVARRNGFSRMLQTSRHEGK
jgi:hypothetical protein